MQYFLFAWSNRNFLQGVVLMREDEQIRERYNLTLERIRMIPKEDSVMSVYRDYFQKTAEFILELDGILNRISSESTEHCELEGLQEENRNIDQDIIEGHYDRSYANPEFAVQTMGEDIGHYLSLLYAELRRGIWDAYQRKKDYLTIRNELFVEIYNCFEDENEPNIKELRSILYWYVSDYYEVFLADRIQEKILSGDTVHRADYHLFLGESLFADEIHRLSSSERFEADHAEDIAFILDKKLLERKLEVVRNSLEQLKDRVTECETNICFEVEKQKGVEPSAYAIRFSEKQISLNAFYNEKEKQIIGQYLKSN